jgi:hypothetical protein
MHMIYGNKKSEENDSRIGLILFFAPERLFL